MDLVEQLQDLPVTGDDFLTVEVTGISQPSPEIRLFTLARPNRAPLPPVEAGAHIDVRLPGGLVRQYSLVDSAASPMQYRFAVRREAEGRGGSRALHDTIGQGDRLDIAGPRNNFPLDEGRHPNVLIAGGIGITPIWCMAQRLATLGRDWTMHYACRSRGDAILLDAMAVHGERVRLQCDDEAPDRFLDIAAIVAGAAPDTHFYCCGPLPMLDAFRAATAAVPDEQVHLEYFSADVDAATEGGFEVELVRSNLILPVPPGKTILDVVAAAGVDIVHSCTEGYCGTCETRVLCGVPDHRDVVLTKAEKASNTAIMICCSGSLTPRLVLDL
jgi:ferredoxin-NADP reductase